MKPLKYFAFLLLFFVSTVSFAQQLPVGSCGIVYIYDDAGNRVRRVYFCNNGVDPYPQRNATDGLIANKSAPSFFTENEEKNIEVVAVDELYPNPTTGIFTIGFSRSLNDAELSIVDMNGKLVMKTRVSGIQIKCDLSKFPSGTYFINLKDKKFNLSKKVIKQ